MDFRGVAVPPKLGLDGGWATTNKLIKPCMDSQVSSAAEVQDNNLTTAAGGFSFFYNNDLLSAEDHSKSLTEEEKREVAMIQAIARLGPARLGLK